jgi:hypothetical protein
MIRKLLAATLILTMLSLSPPRVAASEEGAQEAARTLFTLLAQRNWNIRSFYSSGLLARGESVIIRTTLVGGTRYKLVAAGCEDAIDVDLQLYDENYNYIDGDSDSSILAVVDVQPRWTGTFYLKVTMHSCRGNAAHYVLQYAYE